MKAKEKKTGRIRNRLLALIVPTVLVAIVILVAIVGYISSQRMKEMAVEELDSSISNQGDNIESWLNENLENFQTVKHAIESLHPDEAGLQDVLDAYYGYNSNVADGMRIGTPPGRSIRRLIQKRPLQIPRVRPGTSRARHPSICITEKPMTGATAPWSSPLQVCWTTGRMRSGSWTQTLPLTKFPSSSIPASK